MNKFNKGDLVVYQDVGEDCSFDEYIGHICTVVNVYPPGSAYAYGVQPPEGVHMLVTEEELTLLFSL